jgi:hypothetical protein
LTPNGDTVWTRSFGGPEYERSYTIIETPQHQLAIAGLSNTYSTGYGDAYLTLLDLDGNWIWSKSYGESGGEQANAITATRDGGFILGGNTLGSFGLESSAIMIKTDGEGNVQWSMAFGNGDYDDVTSIIELETGQYMVTGHKNRIMELNSKGFSGCDETIIQTITNDAQTQITNQAIEVGTHNMYSLPYQLGVASGFSIDVVCNYVATEDPAEISNLKIHTDFGQDMIWLEATQGSIGQIKLFDLSGKLCRQDHANRDSYFGFHLPILPPGMYVLAVETNQGWATNKIVRY